MFSSLSTFQSFKVPVATSSDTFTPSNFTITSAFSMIRFKWDAYSSLNSATNSSFKITVSKVDNTTISTRYYFYIRCGTSLTNILTFSGSSNATSNINKTFLSTASVTLPTLTECIVTGLTYNTAYKILIEATSTVSTILTREMIINTANYSAGEIPPNLFKMTDWKGGSSVFRFKLSIASGSTANMLWSCPQLFLDTQAGIWQMRETENALLSAGAMRLLGAFPDQVTRALNGTGGADLGQALMWGIQNYAIFKSNNAYTFTPNTTYRLSCFTLERTGETAKQTIQVWLDPNAGSNYSGAVQFGTIIQESISTTNWIYVTFDYTTPSNFVSGNYRIRLLGTQTTDKSLFVSNMDIIKV